MVITVGRVTNRLKILPPSHAPLSEVNPITRNSPTLNEIKQWAISTSHIGEIIYNCTDKADYPYRYKYFFDGDNVSVVEDAPLELASFDCVFAAMNSGTVRPTNLDIFKDETRVFGGGWFEIEDATVSALIGRDPHETTVVTADSTVFVKSKVLYPQTTGDIYGFGINVRDDVANVIFRSFYVTYKDGREYHWVSYKASKSRVEIFPTPRLISAP